MGKNNSGVDNTVASVENADRTKGGDAALQILNDQLTAYKNGTDSSGPRTDAEVKQYWDAVQAQLREDGVLPELAIAWGRSELRNDFFDAGKGISADDLRDLRRDGADPSASFFDIFEADMAGTLLEDFDDVRGTTENKVGGFLGIGAQDNENITLEDITESLSQIDSRNFMRPLLEDNGSFFKSLDVYGDGAITKEDLQTYINDSHREDDEYKAFARRLLKNWDAPTLNDPDAAQVQRLTGDWGITANDLSKAAGLGDNVWTLEDLQKEYASSDVKAPSPPTSTETTTNLGDSTTTPSTTTSEIPSTTNSETPVTSTGDTTVSAPDDVIEPPTKSVDEESQSRKATERNPQKQTEIETTDPTTYGPLEFAMRAEALQKLADSSLVTSSADSYQNVARRMLGLNPTENSEDLDILAAALQHIHPAQLRGEDQGGPMLTMYDLDKLFADPETSAVITKRLAELVEVERAAVKAHWENNENDDEQSDSSKI